MSKKLFIVTKEIRTVVYADDESDAAEVARQFESDIADEPAQEGWSAHELNYVPNGWEDSSLVWHKGEGDLEFGPLLADCESYKNAMAAHAARKEARTGGSR